MKWFKKKNKEAEPVAEVVVTPVVNEKKPETKTTKKTVAKTTSKASAKTKVASKSKAPTKAVSTPTKAKELTSTYYLTVRKENGKKVGWEVKRGNSVKVSAICKTKEEAKDKVSKLAKNNGATVIIYKMDGSIDETYRIN
ncbi:MAG: DUF2188 domain-containing protein [Mycoplasma sp.]